MNPRWRLSANAPLQSRNTFGIAASAPWLVEISELDALEEVLALPELRDTTPLLLGGDGAISASGNFAPQVSVNLLKAWRDKDVAKAAEYHQTLLQIPQMYQLDTPFVNVIKEAIVLCGRPISTHVLPPASALVESLLV